MLLKDYLVSLFLLLAPVYGQDPECAAKQQERWSYLGDNGPDNWGNNFPDCNGQMQSPISINTEATEPNSSPSDGELSSFGYEISLSGEISNDGHSVKVVPNDDVSRGIQVDGDTYNLVQFHFHFGTTRNNGSEHLINDRGYAMEMHLVHMNDNNELAVVGILFEESRLGNINLTPVTKRLSQIQYQGDKTNVDNINIRRLLPTCNQPVFFRYDGSLTTPGCAENVKWFVLNGSTRVGSSQMRRFRQLYSTTREQGNCPLAGNVRPVQLLNGRQVTAYSGNCL